MGVWFFSRVKTYKNLTKSYEKVISLIMTHYYFDFLYGSTCANFKLVLCKYAFNMVLVVTLNVSYS